MPAAACVKRVSAIAAMIFQAAAFCVPKFEHSCMGNDEELKLRIGRNPFHAIDVGAYSSAHAVDWDGDGDLDLVVASFEGAVHYFKTLADGSVLEHSGAANNPFDHVESHLGGLGVSLSPFVVDWDGDGDLDVILGEMTGKLWYFEHVSTGSLVFRNGTGLNPFDGIDVGSRSCPRAVDLDFDGDLDLVVGNNDGKVLYFERLANDTLAPRVGPGQNPFDAVDEQSAAAPWLADWDGDGDLDLILGKWSGSVKYYEQRSDGSFRSAASNPFGSVRTENWAIPVAVDWDGDGDLDILLGGKDGKVRYWEHVSRTRLVELDGTEPGYDPFKNIDSGYHAMPHAVDWDGDGDLDLLLGDWGGKVQYYERVSPTDLVARTGSALNPFHGLQVRGASAPVAVDWDLDGDLDLVVGERYGQVSYFEHTDAGLVKRDGAGQNPFHGIDVGMWAAPQVFDVDGDGDLDLVAGAIDGKLRYYERLNSSSVVERPGLGQNPFELITTNRGAANPHFIDLDGDGDLDLVIGDWEGKVSYFEHMADGSFVSRTGPGETLFHDIDVGRNAAPMVVDWDNDGDLDLVVGDMYKSGPVRFFERVRKRSLVTRSSPGQSPFHGINVGNGAVPVAVDWDVDGDLDLVVGNNDGRLSYYQRLDDGSLSQHVGPANPFRDIVASSRAKPQVVDWDNDEDLDLIMGDGSGEVHYYERLANSSLVRRVGPGQNPFHGMEQGGPGAAPNVVDWNRDGYLDLLVGWDDGRVRLWLNNGTGALVRDRSIGDLAGDKGRSLPQAVDVDGDGDLDVLLGTGDGRLQYFEHLQDGTLVERAHESQNIFIDIDMGSFIAPQVVDWDNDTDLDLIVGDQSGRVIFFERGGCLVLPTCSYRGMCNYVDGRCQCLNGYDSEDCSVCRAGYSPRSQSDAGLLQCDMCPGGSWSATASSACTLCRENEFASSGSSSCSLCQAGKQPSLDRSACDDCPDDCHSNNGTCQACADGLVPARDRGSCTHCGPGTYAKSGDKACTNCRAGTYAEAASASCTPCGPGTYAGVASGACLPCGSGEYAVAGSGSCTPCAAGFVPTADGSSSELHWGILTAIIAAPISVLIIVTVYSLRWTMRRRARVALASMMSKKDAGRLLQVIELGKKIGVGKALLQEAERVLRMCQSKYIDHEFLLEIIEEGDLKLLKGSWLAAQGGDFRILRQQDLPPEACWTAEDLRAQQRFVLFVAVSYCWLHKVHPDPEGKHLRTLSHACRLRLEVKGPGSVEDIALFLDYASLPQNGERGDLANPEDGDLRDEKAKESFRRGLQQVNILYANQLVEVWMMKWVPETDPRKYMMRGWPFFEQAVAALIKDGTKLLTLEPSIQQCNNWLEVHGLSVEGRRPPMTPDRFMEAIVARSFTNGKTDADFVVQKYKETFEQVVGHATTMWFTQLGWTDAEAEELALVLPHCHNLQQLILRSNSITSKGAIALSQAAQECPCLRGVDLSSNPIAQHEEEMVERHWTERSSKDSEGASTTLRMGSTVATLRLGSSVGDGSPADVCEPKPPHGIMAL